MRIIAILRTSRGWNIPETMIPEAKPIPVCIMRFLDEERGLGLAVEGIGGLLFQQ